MNHLVWWYVARASGIVAWVLLVAGPADRVQEMTEPFSEALLRA